MIIIGVDPHKTTHTATVLETATSTELGILRITASLEDYQRSQPPTRSLAPAPTGHMAG